MGNDFLGRQGVWERGYKGRRSIFKKEAIN